MAEHGPWFALNTDRELWRQGGGDGNGMSYYEPSIHVTEQGSVGINVGGHVFQKSLREWHGLAAEEQRLAPVVLAANRFIEAEAEGNATLIEDAHFQLLRELTDYREANSKL